MGRERLDRLGDANGEDTPCVERLTQCCVIDAEVPRQRVDPGALRCLDAFNSLLDLIKEGQHRAGITWIPLGHTAGKEQACGRVRHDPRLATTLRGTIALAFEDGSDGEIVGIDELTVAEPFPLDEPCGVLVDVRMAVHRRVERLGETLTRGVAERRRLGKELLGVLPQRGDGLSQFQKLLFRLAHQFHEDVPLPSALAAKASHDFFQLLVEALGLVREYRGPAAAPRGDACNQIERFFEPWTGWWHR